MMGNQVGEYPIKFSGRMVRALLDGSKTETRRPVKPQPDPGMHYQFAQYLEDKDVWAWGFFHPAISAGLHGTRILGYSSRYNDKEGLVRSPFGKPGDKLWVQEKFSIRLESSTNKVYTMYKARVDRLSRGQTWEKPGEMVKELSRITLLVTSIKIERLDTIDCLGAKSEGFNNVEEFYKYWDSLYKDEPKFLSSANPWCWVVGFKVLENK